MAKLKDRVAEFDPKAYLYIGCKDGSSFFFIGTAEEFPELIGKADTSVTAAYTHSLNNFKNSAKKCASEKEEQEEKLEALIEEEPAFHDDVLDGLQGATGVTALTRSIKVEEVHLSILKDMKACQDAIRKNESQRVKAEAKAEELNVLIREWTPFSEREVLEEYPHTVDIEGTTLLIEGEVEGSFWFRKDFENWMKKNEKEERK